MQFLSNLVLSTLVLSTLVLSSLDEDLFPIRQVFNLAPQLLAIFPRGDIFPRDAVQLVLVQLIHEAGRKQLDRRVGSSDEVAIHRLHADNVHKALASHFVIGLQDVMEVTDGVIGVACGRSLQDIFKLDHLAIISIKVTEFFHASLHS